MAAINDNYGYPPDYHSAAGEAVILTFVNAFQSVEELTPTAVRNEIRDADPFSTVYGEVSFGEKGVIDKNMLIRQWQPEPGLQTVYPSAVAQSDPVYPMPDWSDR